MDLIVVPHVHWDREWHFTREQSRVLLDRYLADVLDLLDANPRIPCFLFDAQTSLADNFIADHPERKPQLRRLVAQGRLAMGPWYTQCDQMGVHGESILRNLLWGTARARELGRLMPVGYAPDCFGQTAQMPQLLAGLGIHAYVFKRGLDLEAVPSDDFLWRADDGSQITALHTPSYMNFRAPTGDAEKDAALAASEAAKLAPRRLSGAAVLFNGFDQHPTRRDIADIVQAVQETTDDSLQVELGSLEDVMERVAATPDLPVFSGEMTSAQGNRVHKTIHSSRADLKRRFSRLENLLIRQVEPLHAIYWQLTGRQERGVLYRAWAELMEISAHDAVGSCNSDRVNASLGARLDATESSLSAWMDLTLHAIANGCGASPEAVQVYNLLPWERTGWVEMDLVTPWPAPNLYSGTDPVPCVVEESEDVTSALAEQEFWNRYANNDPAGLPESPDGRWYKSRLRAQVSVPALGYATFGVGPNGELEELRDQLVLDNGVLRVEACPDGTVTVHDLVHEAVYPGLCALVDDVDAGDSYDWSQDPAAPLAVRELSDVAWTRQHERLQMRARLAAPKDRGSRAAEVLDGTVDVQLTLELASDAPVIQAELVCENHAVDHRLRLLVPTGAAHTCSWADQSFGVIRRSVDAPHPEDWRQCGYDERPVAIEPMQSVAWVKGRESLVAIMSDSVKEYEVVPSEISVAGAPKDTLALTIFRSFTRMGRADLPDRPGRESGKPWPSPDGALLAEHSGPVISTFAVAFPQDEQACLTLAAQYCCPLICHQERAAELGAPFVMDRCVPEVPGHFSAAELLGNAQASIYKLSEDGQATVLRACALDESPVEVAAQGLVQPASLDEHPLAEAPQPVRNKILTFRIERSDV